MFRLWDIFKPSNQICNILATSTYKQKTNKTKQKQKTKQNKTCSAAYVYTIF